ncbi:MAG: TonB-dependent receptor, partial [Gammaproteobacteria bacterium]|nr:TonB-dependent receptor [Gammaproteobacteria bacterium]
MARRNSLIAGLLCAQAALALEPGAPVVGEPVRQAIDRYDDLNVFSSTRLLPRRMTVQAVPDPNASHKTQIRQMLEPHGLTLVMTDTRTGYVARYEPPEDPPSAAIRRPVVEVPPYIEEVVVYAPFRVERTTRPQSFERQQLDLIPSIGGDTLRALRVLPSVTSDGPSAKHRFRGGDSNEVLYRLDGVVQYAPFHFADAHSLFTVVNPNVVDSADVYVSGFPSRFGSRMSGVVDLHLVEPTRPLHGTVEVSALAAAADARGYLGNWAWLASARVSLLGDVLDAVRNTGESLGIPRFDDELARLSWSDASNEAVFGVLRTGETIDVERESTGERANASFGRHDLWARWQRDHDDRLRTTWQVSHFAADGERAGTTERGEEANGRLDERRSFRITTLGNRWRWTPRRDTEINAGWAYTRHHADFRASLEVEYTTVGLPLRNTARESRRLAFHRSGFSAHAFGSVTRNLTARLTGTVGARYDTHEIAEVAGDEWSARIALAFRAAPAWQVDLDIGRYGQPQFLYEIQIDEGRTELDPPQHADQISVGVAWSATPRLTIRTDLYDRRIGDPWPRFDNLYNRFVLLPELGEDRYLIEPLEVRSRGLELAASYGGERFSWKVAYARTAAQERIASTWHDRSWDQPNSIKVQVAWSGVAWRFAVHATHRSGWPTTPLV